MRVAIINPLPQALAHYTAEIAAHLHAAGNDVRLHPTPSAELGSLQSSRVIAVGHLLRSRSASLRRVRSDLAIITWPVFGYMDLALWRLPRSLETWIVVHDPAPLRRQVGLNARAARLARLLNRLPWRSEIKLLTHSHEAATSLRELGFTTTMLPHPILRPRPTDSRREGQVVVLGQYKEARDVRLLEELGPWLRSRGLRALIAGRGWPEVAGWEVDSRFVSEAEFEALLDTSAAVLVPYNKFFQSGVAVRAAERGTPIVGPRVSALESLYGDLWPGLVADGAPVETWIAAIAAVIDVSSEDCLALANVSWVESQRQWNGEFTR